MSADTSISHSAGPTANNWAALIASISVGALLTALHAYQSVELISAAMFGALSALIWRALVYHNGRYRLIVAAFVPLITILILVVFSVVGVTSPTPAMRVFLFDSITSVAIARLCQIWAVQGLKIPPKIRRRATRTGLLVAFVASFTLAAALIALRLASGSLPPRMNIDPGSVAGYVIGTCALALGAALAVGYIWWLGTIISRNYQSWNGAMLGAVGFVFSFPVAGVALWLAMIAVYLVRAAFGFTQGAPGWSYLANSVGGWAFYGGLFGPVFLGPLALPGLLLTTAIGAVASLVASRCVRVAVGEDLTKLSDPSAPLQTHGN